jgi:hypothetical protein
MISTTAEQAIKETNKERRERPRVGGSPQHIRRDCKQRLMTLLTRAFFSCSEYACITLYNAEMISELYPKSFFPGARKKRDEKGVEIVG